MLKPKKEEEDTNNFFDPKVLKGLPDFNDIPEFKELAAYVIIIEMFMRN